jgi:hypothetical protein
MPGAWLKPWFLLEKEMALMSARATPYEEYEASAFFLSFIAFRAQALQDRLSEAEPNCATTLAMWEIRIASGTPRCSRAQWRALRHGKYYMPALTSDTAT